MQNIIMWIDSREAKIFRLSGETVEGHSHHRHEPEAHLRPHTPRTGHHEQKFFHEVARELAGASALVILGPGVAKDQFKHHLEAHDERLDRAVRAVLPADHPSDAQLAAYARQYFSAHHVRA